MALDYNDPTDRQYGNWSSVADVMTGNTKSKSKPKSNKTKTSTNSRTSNKRGTTTTRKTSTTTPKTTSSTKTTKPKLSVTGSDGHANRMKYLEKHGKKKTNNNRGK